MFFTCVRVTKATAATTGALPTLGLCMFFTWAWLLPPQEKSSGLCIFFIWVQLQLPWQQMYEICYIIHWQRVNQHRCTFRCSNSKQKGTSLEYIYQENHRIKPAHGSICAFSTFSDQLVLASPNGALSKKANKQKQPLSKHLGKRSKQKQKTGICRFIFCFQSSCVSEGLWDWAAENSQVQRPA